METARALECEGIAVAADGAPADFTVVVLPGDAGWRLHDADGVHQLDSLGALVAHLRGLLPLQTADPAVR